MSTPLKHWDKRHVTTIVKEVRKDLGAAWDLFGAEVKIAFIHHKVFGTVRMQARESVSIEAMDELLFACLEEAGLNE